MFRFAYLPIAIPIGVLSLILLVGKCEKLYSHGGVYRSFFSSLFSGNPEDEASPGEGLVGGEQEYYENIIETENSETSINLKGKAPTNKDLEGKELEYDENIVETENSETNPETNDIEDENIGTEIPESIDDSEVERKIKYD